MKKLPLILSLILLFLSSSAQAAATITWVALGTVDSGNGNVTPGLPAGHTTNDILVLIVQSSNESISAPTGYTEITESSASPQGTGTAATAGSVRLAVFWKRDNGSESAPTVTDTGNHTIARIFAVRGAITSGSPIDVANGAVVSSASASVTMPSLTTTVDHTAVISIAGHAIDSNSATTSSWTLGNLNGAGWQFDDNSTNTGTGGGWGFLHIFGANDEKTTAGSVGSITTTLSSSSKQANIIFALKPPTVITATNTEVNFSLTDDLFGF